MKLLYIIVTHIYYRTTIIIIIQQPGKLYDQAEKAKFYYYSFGYIDVFINVAFRRMRFG